MKNINEKNNVVMNRTIKILMAMIFIVPIVISLLWDALSPDTFTLLVAAFWAVWQLLGLMLLIVYIKRKLSNGE